MLKFSVAVSGASALALGVASSTRSPSSSAQTSIADGSGGPETIEGPAETNHLAGFKDEINTICMDKTEKETFCATASTFISQVENNLSVCDDAVLDKKFNRIYGSCGILFDFFESCDIERCKTAENFFKIIVRRDIKSFADAWFQFSRLAPESWTKDSLYGWIFGLHFQNRDFYFPCFDFFTIFGRQRLFHLVQHKQADEIRDDASKQAYIAARQAFESWIRDQAASRLPVEKCPQTTTEPDLMKGQLGKSFEESPPLWAFNIVCNGFYEDRKITDEEVESAKFNECSHEVQVVGLVNTKSAGGHIWTQVFEMCSGSKVRSWDIGIDDAGLGSRQSDIDGDVRFVDSLKGELPDRHIKWATPRFDITTEQRKTLIDWSLEFHEKWISSNFDIFKASLPKKFPHHYNCVKFTQELLGKINLILDVDYLFEDKNLVMVPHTKLILTKDELVDVNRFAESIDYLKQFGSFLFWRQRGF
eukprot:gene41-700_t